MTTTLDTSRHVCKQYRLIFLVLALLQTATGFGEERRFARRVQIGAESSQATQHNDNYYAALPFAPTTAGPSAIGALPEYRLPGEFEHQRALLLAGNDLIDEAPELFLEIVKQGRGRIDIVMLVCNIEQGDEVRQLLQGSRIPHGHVHLVELPHDTMWARDYGPMVVESRSGLPLVVDADYDLSRAKDDQVPGELARLLNVPVMRTPLRIDGGNLLSNGAGLAITTGRLFEDNAIDDHDEQSLRSSLRDNYGLNELIVLEPLAGEATGHVDMFATFTSTNTVVIGQYDAEHDPENAAILDRNADKLTWLQTAQGPLQVVRIPMPSHGDGFWRTYTNVVYANGVLLVPTYGNVDQEERSIAISTYARLLRKWHVVGIDASRLIESEGALHCITMNLGPLRSLPTFPAPQLHAVQEQELVDIGSAFDSDALPEETNAAFARPARFDTRRQASDGPRTTSPFLFSDEELAAEVEFSRRFMRQPLERRQPSQPNKNHRPREAAFDFNHYAPAKSWTMPYRQRVGSGR